MSEQGSSFRAPSGRSIPSELETGGSATIPMLVGMGWAMAQADRMDGCSYHAMAIAALEAIREPSEALLDAADGFASDQPVHIAHAWPKAIDAILEGKA